MLQKSTPPVTTVWFLAELARSGKTPRQHTINTFPFRIGRLPSLELCLPVPGISKQHAEIVFEAGAPTVYDLASTNGTYVNGQRIDDMIALREGDLLQLANEVFKIGHHLTYEDECTIIEGRVCWAQALCDFDRLISEPAVESYYQPIVSLIDAEIVGYESLARSRVGGLENPAAMFTTAASLDCEVQLSELLRSESVHAVSRLDRTFNLFLNTHPKEIGTQELLDSLSQLRTLAPTLPITIEIHEAAITDANDMRRLCDHMSGLDMQLAYDDFGAGQARLDELTSVTPDVVKFDICLVRNIDQASRQRLGMVESLVKMLHDLGIRALAEGVETSAEAAACRHLGFDLAQGYHFGRPAPLD